MATRDNEELGTYAQWANGFNAGDTARRLHDQATIRRAQLNDGNEYTRYTPAQGNQRACDTVRANRDDLEFRDWNSEFGFSGAERPMNGPGMVGRGQESDAQKSRHARKKKLDDGF